MLLYLERLTCLLYDPRLHCVQTSGTIDHKQQYVLLGDSMQSMNYNNLPDDKPKSASTQAAKSVNKPFRAFQTPLEKPRYRITVIGAWSLGASVVLAVISLFFDDEVVLQFVILVLSVAIAIIWAANRLRRGINQPYISQQALIGFSLPVAVAVLTVLISAGLSVPVVAVGLILLLITAVVLQFVPLWVVPLQSGEAYYHDPIFGPPNFISYSADETNAGPAYRWMTSFDKFQMVWRLDQPIKVDMRIDHIITQEGYPFALQIRLEAFFNPSSADPAFRSTLIGLGSPEERMGTLADSLKAAIDITARAFFIGMPHQKALASGSVVAFKEQLPTLMGDRNAALGLQLDLQTIVCIPYGTDEAMSAVNRAAAAPYNTTAALAVQKELLRQALAGDASAQLVLYAQMVARGGNDINYLPDLMMPELSDSKAAAQRFLRAAGDNPDVAKQLFAQFFGLNAEDIAFQDVPPSSMPSRTPSPPPADMPRSRTNPNRSPKSSKVGRRRTFNFADEDQSDES